MEEKYLALENIVKDMDNPSIMDVKMGTRLYDDEATPEKRDKMINLVNTTTSKTIGFRISGIKVFKEGNYKVYGKDFGKSLTEDTIGQGINYFLLNNAVCKHKFTDRLKEIEEIVRGLNLRLYSTSLLFVYEGSRCDIRLIDFAHSYPNRDGEPDDGFLLGVHNLIRIITNLC
jgi:1D-myo-inositol-tetrakisphosphate 5-kinase/inositol-polyphosphate multikinase